MLHNSDQWYGSVTDSGHAPGQQTRWLYTVNVNGFVCDIIDLRIHLKKLLNVTLIHIVIRYIPRSVQIVAVITQHSWAWSHR